MFRSIRVGGCGRRAGLCVGPDRGWCIPRSGSGRKLRNSLQTPAIRRVVSTSATCHRASPAGSQWRLRKNVQCSRSLTDGAQLDAAFFAALEELCSRADRAVEEAAALRATIRDIVQARVARIRPIGSGLCHVCGAPLPITT